MKRRQLITVHFRNFSGLKILRLFQCMKMPLMKQLVMKAVNENVSLLRSDTSDVRSGYQCPMPMLGQEFFEKVQRKLIEGTVLYYLSEILQENKASFSIEFVGRELRTLCYHCETVKGYGMCGRT
ncbi:hypothetical protein RCL_jg25132.t1 [Rhizophagus clarus]|uniref:Uncharacterized protein n=1 Tax=Rhizophagus clarus TaxID=94130 RepID=A0A8H3LM28_9GLOM|nr:hypothetical protein RCL_jg25132.t1 [Rhizophagus clarus]